MSKALSFLPAAVCAGLIFWVSTQTHLPAATPDFPGADKLLHGLAYAVLTGLMLWGARRSGLQGRVWPWVLIACLYGASDELHQAFVKGRDCSVLDWGADTAGALLCALLWQTGARLSSRRSALRLALAEAGSVERSAAQRGGGSG